MVHTLLVVATLAALYLLYLLRNLLITVFLAVVFASALRPIVCAAERRLGWPRPVVALALYGAIALAGVAGLAAVVPTVIGGATALLGRSGEIYGRWYDLVSALQAGAQARLGVALPVLPAQREVEALLSQAATGLQQALPAYTLRAGGALAEILLGLVMAYYWLEARDALVSLGLRLLPAQRRQAFQAVFDDIEHVLGAYLAGQLILSLLIGVASLLAFAAIGLPHAPALALASGLLHMIPILGATVGTVGAVLVAGALSPVKGLATGVVLLLIHQLENNFVAPRVLQRQVGLNPLLVLVALAAGGTLGGAVGVLVAIPALGALSILARHMVVEPLVARRRAAEAQSDGLESGST